MVPFPPKPYKYHLPTSPPQLQPFNISLIHSNLSVFTNRASSLPISKHPSSHPLPPSADMSSTNFLTLHKIPSFPSDDINNKFDSHKKSTISLSQNSLLICTESLGSESGSDGFSSDPSSEYGDFDEEMVKKTEYQETETFEWNPIKFDRKKTPPRSFPPPISTLNSPAGDSLSIQSRRENGRLILHAVSLPNRKIFHADRRDGRLILSCVKTPADFDVREDEHELVSDPRLSTSVMNFHRLAMMMKNPNGLINRNPAWPIEKQPLTPLSHSLPPRPPSRATATAAVSLNSYEYYWRSKPAGIQNPISQKHNQPIKNITQKFIYSNNEIGDEKKQILILKGNRGDYSVPLSSVCKLPRRSFLLREPCCIATT